MPEVTRPDGTGLETDPLSNAEKERFDLMWDRSFRDIYAERANVLGRELQEYKQEALTAAQAAKSELSGNFDGGNPNSSAFGADRMFAGYFGYNTWLNVPDASANTVTTWIDNAAPDNLSGTGGQDNPLRVGEPAVHLIMGYEDYSPSPKASRVKLWLNDQPRTATTTEENFFGTPTSIVELDSPVFLKEDDTIYGEFYADTAGSHALKPFGITFVEASDYRTLDPANLAGTDTSNVAVE